MADEIITQSSGKIKPGEINPKLAAIALGKELANGDNPTLAIETPDFCLGNALMENINIEFFGGGLTGVTNVFKCYEKHSPSIGGVGRSQLVDVVVNASRPAYQMISGMPDDKPGLLSKVVNFIRGTPSES